jgi:hypothetical protein
VGESVYVYECVCVCACVCVIECESKSSRWSGEIKKKTSTYVCNFLLSGCRTANPGRQKGQGVSDPSL